MLGNRRSNDSDTALVLPGKFTIKVSPLVPDIPLESIDNGVLLWPYDLMASEIPFASLSITILVASGVTSLLLNPVPPDVIIRSTFFHQNI